MTVVNIDEFKRVALQRLEEIKKRIEDGEVVGFAMAEVYKDGATGNSWCVDDRPVALIGELHCLMADMEYFEVDLRKNQEQY